jgi:ubiquinone/menaquinone biosynthesis C-methylase UbiE
MVKNKREWEVMKYLDILYPEKNVESKKLFARKFAEWVNNRFFKSKGKLLDVGCGRGFYVDGFNDMGYKAYGIDKESCRKDVITVDLEKEKIPFPKNSFDYLFCKTVIAQLSDPAHMLQECHRILKKSGKMFILETDYESSVRRFLDDFLNKRPYTKKSINRLLEAHGFKILKITDFRNTPYIWRYSLSAFDFHLPKFLFDANFIAVLAIKE